MPTKVVSILMVTLLLIGILSLAFNIQPVKASETIFIRADGTIDPLIVPIQRNGDQYIFTGNIHDSIVIEKNNIIVDGVGYTLEGTGDGKGIDLTGRNNVTIRNMKINRFYHGIYLYESSNNTIYGNDIEGNNLQAPGADGIYLLRSSNNNISGNNIKNNGDGIEFVSYSSNNRISGNNITKNYEGIDLWYSSNNTISKNNITANHWDGIELFYSSYNTISENNITANYYDGIKISNSSYTSVSGNNIENNGDGVELMAYSINNRILKNNITNNMHGVKLEEHSNNNSVVGNNIRNNRYGIDLHDSSNNIISGNSITAINHGIYLDNWSSNNTFFANKITNSKYGILLEFSSNNMFYHNYLSDNTIQASCYQSLNVWDNGVEGNYWRDYRGEDLNGNGIGDTSHVINEDNQDNYPLMNPYVDVNYDGQVNIIDIAFVAKAFGANLGDPNYNLHADVDCNGSVNIIDIAIVAKWYGHRWQYL